MAESVSRRKFLSRATAAIGMAFAAAWGIPAVAYVLGPARKRDRATQRVVLGAADKVSPGSPTLFKALVSRTTGWVSTEEEIGVYVVTEDGRTFTGLSNVCTHLGCRVRWVDEGEGFFCPCHNAVFSVTGEVVSGPPPRPLERYEVSVENGQLSVDLEA